MPAGWIKSLQCKQRAVNDVVESHHVRLLPASSSCRKSSQSLKDVVETKSVKKASLKPTVELPERVNKHPGSRKPENITRVRSSNASSNLRRHSRPPESYIPALTDLPVGHPSRNVVEIIFHTSWSPKVFSGRIEMVFKVQNSGRVVTRFEEYRELVKSGSGSMGNSGSGQPGSGDDHARCVADGNEVMRFQCLGSTAGSGYETDDSGSWSFQWGKGAALCTFSGSGAAHESAGGGRGRKAMLVCRVIAGRVRKHGFESGYGGRVGYDSVSGENGELLVFDSRAVLPCFLIIYNL
ncbi:hypothetical protein HanRHA438_Chr17g0811281 [Helianthus annuus]|uniref:Poly(ADP-ribose) polymerase, catalytic domain-containing protein n=1 Tax=Helianthus annuus TaxID=4232 RepID=A0A251RRH0_HELAN|nr:uncharacterized protein LOC110922497 [Helianthus annuus]KAF5755307.1 hypothetical protein HanXRQr2_Chr17g0801321 [Helianthus annuus]KAJ0429088.1 hypothetical protein HanHA300_Chr17g0653391 [Helianthus annuus]KAJ0433320.1 hypothetical protein HanIR_Chr17g0868961 [Helianthus annuus]KAJ0447400.1 hypothetical protein HanHA89_Chr17g0704971 [Helianthus annuus]KAJ0632279.1 hypothetical protein HanLR1_Chr17g0663371 [Helianthus annuus]